MTSRGGYWDARRVWRYQRGNQNQYIEEEQTTQWPKEKVQKDKQRSTKHTYKTKDRVTRTPLKSRGELRCSGRVSSSCSTSDTRRVNLVTNPVISHERGKDREVFTTSGHCWHRYSIAVNQVVVVNISLVITNQTDNRWTLEHLKFSGVCGVCVCVLCNLLGLSKHYKKIKIK